MGGQTVRSSIIVATSESWECHVREVCVTWFLRKRVVGGARDVAWCWILYGGARGR